MDITYITTTTILLGFFVSYYCNTKCVDSIYNRIYKQDRYFRKRMGSLNLKILELKTDLTQLRVKIELDEIEEEEEEEEEEDEELEIEEVEVIDEPLC